MEAVFVVTIQLTPIAAATPTPPLLLSPVLLLVLPPAWVVLSFAFGTLLPLTPLSLAFGLLSTCFFVLLSALSSLPSEPFALADALVALFTIDSAVIVTVPVAETLRLIAALVVQLGAMLMATSAPIALLPAASAFASVLSAVSVCVAWTWIEPLAFS